MVFLPGRAVPIPDGGGAFRRSTGNDRFTEPHTYDAVQALWTAAHYRSGVLIVELSNGRYAVMDQLAAKHGDGGGPPWPPFEELRAATVARGLGCPAMEVDDLPGLEGLLDAPSPSLAERAMPLLLDVSVAPGAA